MDLIVVNTKNVCKVCSFWRIWWPLKRPGDDDFCCSSLLGASVLGHSLGTLRHGVLGQLSGQQETDGGLDFSGGDGGPPVVVSQTGCLGSDALEDVVHEGVHDGHGLGADASVGVDLLQDFVDVDGVGFPPPPLLLLLAGPRGLGLGGGFFRSLGCWFGWHVDLSNAVPRPRIFRYL